MTMSFATGEWTQVLRSAVRADLERLLLDTLQTKRWFGGKARVVSSANIEEAVRIPYASMEAQLLFVRVEFAEGNPETYLLPIAFAHGDTASRIRNEFPHAVIANVLVEDQGQQTESLLYDTLWDQDFSQSLLEGIARGQTYQGLRGTLGGSRTKAFSALVGKGPTPTPSVMKAEQSNTSVAYGERVILKLYRRLGEGINPDLEIGQTLTNIDFPHVPPVAGALQYEPQEGQPVTVAILQGFVRNQGDAWRYTLRALDEYYDNLQAKNSWVAESSGGSTSLLDLSYRNTPAMVSNLIGGYLDSAKKLGRRTAELHLALSRNQEDPAFAPETISPDYLQSRHGSMCRITTHTLALLRGRAAMLPDNVCQEANLVLEQESKILQRFEAFRDLQTTAKRIRCHGDYHLGQVLWTGGDFMIIDFEGEPARPLSERRTKHSPLLDVAGMLRSFHYAPYASLYNRVSGARDLGRDKEHVTDWAESWYRWVAANFLKSYVAEVSASICWPPSWKDAKVLLDAHLLEKAVYELGYELNNRPDWVRIPLQGMRQLLESPT